VNAPAYSNNSQYAVGPRRHYTFQDAMLEPTVAHEGVGQILTRRVEGGDPSQGANFIDLTILPPGASIGVHRHGPDNEELYIVVSGHGRMLLDGKEFDVGPGDVVVNSALGQHALCNLGSEPIRLVVVEVPLRQPEAIAC
jgi:mannose-6-phosphate isomerase-like protein (cupin superfamily)